MAKRTGAGGHGTRALRLKRNFCFGCGPDNGEGMRLEFFRENQRFVSTFRLGRRYTGPPGHCHGGIIATILDEAMSKLSQLREVAAATSRMTVDYLRPVPLYRELRVVSRERGKRGRRLTRSAEILDETGAVLARSRGVFVIIDPERVFGKARGKRRGGKIAAGRRANQPAKI